ncbi:Alpha/Beta hydrolase protein [Earliella scabrosa]|nr:Alpha/Beta hydrolase protein [Earliella scabrosa]
MPPLSSRLIHDIRSSHLKQLAQLQPPPPNDPKKAPTDEPDSTLLTKVLEAIKANPEAIKAAQDTQCSSTSPSAPNWDVVFFGLTESTAMMLRKTDKIVAASNAAREGNYDEGVKLLAASQEDIDQVAAALDCTFVQLCDFVDQSPQGHLYLSGAYCGAFISNSTQRPFIGIAFKGTNTCHEWMTDFDFKPIAPLMPDVLWGAQVHEGFYLGLFGPFANDGDVQVPFDLLEHQLAASYRDNARLHFTGISLGGAYTTMTYAEFLRRHAAGASSFTRYNFGDMYSFGAPRTCFEPFASRMNALTQREGSGKYAFRIVNHEDPVPMMPPPPAVLVNPDDYPFIHPAGAWKLGDDGPIKMADEPPPVPPPSIDELKANAHYHLEYYTGWQKTPHS